MEKSRIYVVKVRTSQGEYQGTFHSPMAGRRLAEVMNKIEGFISLKDVVCLKSKERYPFIVINKSAIEIISVITESTVGEGEPP